MKNLIVLLISGALVVSGYSQTRNVLVGTNNAVVQPTNFWSADASNARTGLGLGSAATNPVSAFQPSSATLSNLSVGNGAGLTNITASSVSTALAISNTTGLQAALDGKVATNGSAVGLTNFPTIVLQTNSTLSIFPAGLLRTNGSAIGLTNFPVIPVASGGTGGTNESTARAGIGLGTTNSLTIAGVTAQNLTITAGGGITLQATLTNAASFRTNIGLPFSGLTSADAPSFRTALGLDTAATNPVSAFQASSANLTNLAANNGGALTNLTATSIVGIIPSSNIATVNFSNLSGTLAIASGGTGATNAANARQNLGSTTVGDAVFIATNAAAARTTIGATTVGSSVFTLANPSAITFLRLNADNTATALSDSSFRTAIGLGETNNGIFATLRSTQVASSGVFSLTLGQTNTGFRGIGAGTSDFGYYRDGNLIWQASSTNLTINQGIAFAATAAATTRTNLGLGLAALTNTTVSALRSALELGPTNAVAFQSLAVTNTSDQLVAKFEGPNGNPLEIYTTDEGLESGYGGSNYAIGVGQSGLQIKYGTASSEWGNPVIVDNEGEVVRPTNFWQVAPITTTFIDSQPTTNQTTNIAAGRNLHIHSIAFSTVGITNTIALPTTNSFNGDIALVVHQGPTSSVTAVRTAGAGTNLITLNQFEEAVEFVYYNSVWQFNHNRSFIEPIFFSGTNAAANAAASRTNLGLGTTNNVAFNNISGSTISGGTIEVANQLFIGDEATLVFDGAGADNWRTNLGLGATWLTNSNVTNFRTAIGLGVTNEVTFSNVSAESINNSGFVKIDVDDMYLFNSNGLGNVALDWGGVSLIAGLPISFATNTAADTTRTNLGIPLAALTNTNNANFQAAIFNTNSVPTNSANVNAINFNTAIHWMEVNVVTNGVTNNFRIPLFK
jgi:hypothetical protein